MKKAFISALLFAIITPINTVQAQTVNFGASGSNATNGAPTSSYTYPAPTNYQTNYQTSGCVDIYNNLGLGNGSQEVANLQNFLRQKGFFYADSTGYFGSITQSAVRQYQSNRGISSTGFVGPLTRTQIRNESCGQQTYQGNQTNNANYGYNYNPYYQAPQSMYQNTYQSTYQNYPATSNTTNTNATAGIVYLNVPATGAFFIR